MREREREGKGEKDEQRRGAATRTRAHTAAGLRTCGLTGERNRQMKINKRERAEGDE